MRVLQVLEATLGGTRRYLQDVARASEPGVHNGLAYSLVRADAAFFTLLAELQAGGWETFEIPMRRAVGMHDYSAALQLRRVIASFRPDVVHAQSSKAGALARIALGIGKTRSAMVYSPHAIAVDLSPAYALAERILAPRLDAIVAVADSERESLERLNLLPPARIYVVPPTIDATYFAPRDRASARGQIGYGEGPLIVASGRLAAQKDPLGFVRFMQALLPLVPGVRGIWVGDGVMRREFEAALDGTGLASSVAITGWVNDVRPFFAAADVFVSTSAYESFGYVTAEALASERPVVASAITGTVDIVTTDTERQLYPQGDFECAAQLASELLNDRDLANSVARRAREAVLKDFAAERTRENLYAAYDRALRYRFRNQPSRLTKLVDRVL